MSDQAHRISVPKALAMARLDDITECDDSVVPACSSEGCEVEPDGKCEHGLPSVLLVAGLI